MKTETLEPKEATNPTTEQLPAGIHLKNILVPLDFSKTSLRALQYAVPFAKQFEAKLTLVHIVELPVYGESPFATALGPDELAKIKTDLECTCATRIPPELTVEVEVRQEAVLAGILDLARERSADLIITTTHGRTGLKHVVMGSTAEDLVRRANCPVLVLHEREHEFV